MVLSYCNACSKYMCGYEANNYDNIYVYSNKCSNAQGTLSSNATMTFQFEESVESCAKPVITMSTVIIHWRTKMFCRLILKFPNLRVYLDQLNLT